MPNKKWIWDYVIFSPLSMDNLELPYIGLLHAIISGTPQPDSSQYKNTVAPL